jgi:hypothetical protein
VGPAYVYGHSGGRCSITGGYVYRGKSIPELEGRYVFGDWCAGRIWSLRIVDGRATDVRMESPRVRLLDSFGQDPRGELYAVSLAGRIYRLAG